MAIEVNLKIRDYSSGVEGVSIDSQFVRRSFSAVFQATISLTGGATTDVDTNLSSIEFVYVVRTGDETDISIYPNLSPQRWEFDNSFLCWGATGLTSIKLGADADTEVKVFLGGS